MWPLGPFSNGSEWDESWAFANRIQTGGSPNSAGGPNQPKAQVLNLCSKTTHSTLFRKRRPAGREGKKGIEDVYCPCHASFKFSELSLWEIKQGHTEWMDIYSCTIMQAPHLHDNKTYFKALITYNLVQTFVIGAFFLCWPKLHW